ncbi:General stress protein A [Crateriforma conspicua]|uniref:General stress protein A n=1 Tax=Crateriforma conspicua TaxID=2527996 RepID=A0A5C6FDL9_9PLAN|nr:glycosyltransferase family 8 protein [Crateriforma conspicua]TWU59568.1 General stress protein A [Crateriforma conspicua]
MDKIPIVLGADQGYFPGLLATVFTTLASSTDPKRFEFYVFDGGLAEASKQKIAQLICDFGNENSVQWLIPDPKHFDGLVSMHGNYLEYARLLLPTILNLEKVVWLDADVLVFRDCVELWDFDSCDLPIAASHEDARFECDVSNLDELGISRDAPYFNTGVMLMNLASLRSSNFTERAISYLKMHDGYYLFYDQSAINVVLYKRIAELPREFNFLNRLYKKKPTSEMVVEGGYNYHFLERPKPWQRYSGEPHAEIFYGIMSLLKEPMPLLDSFANRLNRLKWQFPRLAATYYRWTPRRLTAPNEMQMCESVWRQSADLKRISATGCFKYRLTHLSTAHGEASTIKTLSETRSQ